MLPIQPRSAFAWRALRPVAACWIVCWVGCGLSTYEERLQRTDERNRYFHRLDESLDNYWNQPAYQIWLRPPKAMYGVPAPQPPKDGGELPPDARQEFQGVALDLPGIIHAWDGTMSVAGGGTGPCRLYLLGNYERFVSSGEGRSNDPKDFVRDLEAVLQNLYGVVLPPGDSGRADQNNVRYRVQIPTTERFAVPKTFQAVTFVAPQEGAVPFQAWLYEHTAGPIQFAVLMLTPPAPSTEAAQGLRLALETLRVSSEKPRLQPGGRPGAAPTAAPQVNF